MERGVVEGQVLRVFLEIVYGKGLYVRSSRM